MRRSTSSVMLPVTAIGLLLATSVLAQDQPAKPADKPANPAQGSGNEVRAVRKGLRARPPEVATALRKHKLRLAPAVAAAAEHSKGQPVAIWGDVIEDQVQFVVHCVVDEKCMSVTVEQNGKVSGMIDAVQAEELRVHNGRAADVWKAMEKENMTLAKAIEAAVAHHKDATLVNAVAKFHGKAPEVYFTAATTDGKVQRSEIGASGPVRDIRPRNAGGEAPAAGKSDEKEGHAEKP